MSTYNATVRWNCRESREGFAKGQYSRAHEWSFDGGTIVPASASPHIVPAPWSNAAAVDPEEAFVAALSSCHLLSFLYVAAKRGIVVETYVDDAEGVMDRNEQGRLAITRVVLRPRVTYATAPDAETEAALHHQAHEDCYIANSVRTEVLVEPVAPA